jgi:hypothetical protein
MGVGLATVDIDFDWGGVISKVNGTNKRGESMN